MPFLPEMETPTGFVSAELRDRGLELRETYQAARPFPHIVIDDFLPTGILEQCLREFPSAAGADGEAAREYDRAQERLKSQYNPDALPAPARTLFYSFNSRPFIRLLENITGISGLIPDPYFLGAGFHEIGQGGHLSVHVDFNHHKLMNLERRINVLIYLNKDWEDEYGGQLELWNADMTSCVQSIIPSYNRCVIFNTSEFSYHGNPNPIKHPLGITRKSIALYYYTSTWSDIKREHTTQFRVRPGSGDRRDVQTRAKELALDLTPPIMRRALRNIRGRQG
jgi:hypothetical protein